MSELKYMMVDKRYWDWLDLLSDVYDDIISSMPVDVYDMMDPEDSDRLDALAYAKNQIEGDAFWEVDLGE